MRARRDFRSSARTISLTMSSAVALQLAPPGSRDGRARATMSASVSRSQFGIGDGRRPGGPPTACRPSPAGAAAPASTVNRSAPGRARAMAAVAVVAVVVHQHDAELAGVVLCQQAADAAADQRRLVAGRHDDRDVRCIREQGWRKRRAGLPEPAMREHQVQPGQQAKEQTKNSCADHAVGAEPADRVGDRFAGRAGRVAEFGDRLGAGEDTSACGPCAGGRASPPARCRIARQRLASPSPPATAPRAAGGCAGRLRPVSSSTIASRAASVMFSRPRI